MKPTSEILERIEKCSSEHKDGVFTRLYRYLLREDIYYAAYQKLYANKGATTQGIDDDTADGFSDFYVKELIQSLKDGTYKANPVRREYIPKKNGKLRPLGIPSFRDKLLQEVVRMILEAIYEPVFDSHSHGFRPGKSCHTALRQISSDFTGVVWLIEGDIQGCFDNINHEKLIEILSRKIKDSRFLNIIRQFLKAGYIENWKYNATYSGSPQGGLCQAWHKPPYAKKEIMQSHITKPCVISVNHLKFTQILLNHFAYYPHQQSSFSHSINEVFSVQSLFPLSSKTAGIVPSIALRLSSVSVFA